MNENTKKILMYSGIGIGVIIAFYVGYAILSKVSSEMGSGGSGGGGSAQIQPTISTDQATSIANAVFNQIDDVNYISGIDETIQLLSLIQNVVDWNLVKTAYGVREKINFGFFNNYTGDLVGALNDEYGDDEEDMNKLRNFFATKGIKNAI